MKPRIFSNLFSIAESFKGILLDAYGVFWGGNHVGLLPGSKETMEKLVREGKIVGILSNSTQMAAKEIEKLKNHGLIQNEHFHFFITSGEIAKKIFHVDKLPFKTTHKKYWLFGENHPKFSSHQWIFNDSAYLETQNIEQADFIYISIPHRNGEDQTDPNLFRKEVIKITNSGLPMICVNPDHFAHEGNPPKAVVRQGTIAALYEELGGQVIYLGKPSSLAFSTAMNYYSHYEICHPKNILMVGDTPETDIKGAHQFGMPSALITETGIMADRIFNDSFENILKNSPKDERPDFYIKRLG